jgi:hypothetical protein
MNQAEHELIERLIRNLSHELKNPLTTIKGYAQLASMSMDDPEALKKSQHMILSQVEKINGVLEELYRIFSHSGGPTERVVVRGVIEDMIAGAGNSGARVELAGDGSPEARANLPGLKRLIGALVLGFDWKNNPGTLLKVVLLGSGEKGSVSFRYQGSRFDDLAPDTFFLPFATKRHFLAATELYEAAVIAHAHGWNLRLEQGDDHSTLDLVF